MLVSHNCYKLSQLSNRTAHYYHEAFSPHKQGRKHVHRASGCTCKRIEDSPAEAAKSDQTSASRQQVFLSCSVVSATLLAGAAAVRAAAPGISHLLQQDSSAVSSLLQVPLKPDIQNILVAFAAAAVVTGARLTLLSIWPAFMKATNASNGQVLPLLTHADLIWLSCLPAISEEALFRGALIPATFPDWRGVVLAAAVFGALHKPGARNWAFAAWASAVGMLYGACFVQTQDLLVPITAHAAANYASASLWLQKQAKP